MARVSVACALALALTLSAVTPCLGVDLVWPPIVETPTSRHIPGKWVWAELFTEDVGAAAKFYGEAFGWSFRTLSAARGPGYTLAFSGDDPVGGMLQRQGKDRKQPGARWIGMISVPDVKAAARYASAQGGKVVVAPRMLKGRGEVALLADPEGAPFGVIRSTSGDPDDYLGDDRQWIWIELWARDPKAMARFYGGLGGYEVAPAERPDGSPGYVLASGGYARCGIIASPAPAVAPAWLPYLRVEDVKAATAQAERSGARVVVAPDAGIREGRVALIVDPTGASIGLAQWEEETVE